MPLNQYYHSGSAPVFLAVLPPVATPVKNQAVSHRYMVPEKYKGDTTLEYYLSKFDEVSDWNGWSDRERAQQLRFSLSEKYDKALKGIPEERKYDYCSVKAALKQYVGEDSSRDGSDAETFWKRTLSADEKVQEYAADIRVLGEKAFKKNPKLVMTDFETYEKTLLSKFMSGLENPHMERWIHGQSPQSLQDALTSAIEFQSFEKPDAVVQKPKIYQISPAPAKTQNPSQSSSHDDSNQLSEVLKMVKTLSIQFEEFKRTQISKMGTIEARLGETQRDIKSISKEITVLRADVVDLRRVSTSMQGRLTYLENSKSNPPFHPTQNSNNYNNAPQHNQSRPLN